MVDLLPAAPAAALDVGAGSGRDAAWLSSRGYDVVAVEPSARMRVIARARHADPAIRWLADALPALPRTVETGLTFDPQRGLDARCAGGSAAGVPHARRLA